MRRTPADSDVGPSHRRKRKKESRTGKCIVRKFWNDLAGSWKGKGTGRWGFAEVRRGRERNEDYKLTEWARGGRNAAARIFGHSKKRKE